MTTDSLHLFQGDALPVLQGLPDEVADAVITDPPYSSGGLTRSDRMADPAQKYEQSGTTLRRLTFSGDNRDQRSWAYWCQLWLSECRRVAKPGAYLCMFTDWRQLPIATDAVQAAGWVWRGIVVWDKGEGARAPHKGYFRHQAEYLVWGSNGPLPANYEAGTPGPFPGVFKYPVKQADKFHLTGKPTELMKRLVEIVPAGSVVLDPFMGSGTTGVACNALGRKFVGVEYDAEYYKVACERMTEEAAQ